MKVVIEAASNMTRIRAIEQKDQNSGQRKKERRREGIREAEQWKEKVEKPREWRRNGEWRERDGLLVEQSRTGLFVVVLRLATSKVISGWVPSCGSEHSCWLYSINPDLTWYPALPHYSHTRQTLFLPQSLPYSNHNEHLARKWQLSILISLVWLNPGSNLAGSHFRSPNTGDGRSSH